MRWRRWVDAARRSPRDVERDVDEELSFHLSARAEDLMAQGVAPADALDRARREFGDVDDARRYATHIDRRTAVAAKRRDDLGVLRQDVKFALRGLRRAPGFSAAALVTLAIGIGATTGIFSVVSGVLLRPLPYPSPDRLYRVWTAHRPSGAREAPVSAMDLDDWRAQRVRIEDMGGYWYQSGGSGLDFTGSGEPERLAAVFVTPGFFGTMGVQPQLGRLPREDEVVRGGRDRFVVLTHAFWQRRFAGRPDVVGSALTLNGEPFTVLGVLRRGFAFPTATADVFASFSIFTDDQIPRLRGVRILGAVARARPGEPEAAVTEELQTMTRRLAGRFPENAAWDGATVLPLRAAIARDVSRSLWVLLGAVVLLLLIACVNVASLQLARATARDGEVAVRAALGATRGRLVRQLLTESVVLSLMGGALGTAVATLLLRGVLTLASGRLPRGADVAIDGPVLAFALLLSIGTGVAFGLFPAWRTSRDLQTALRGARGGGPLRSPLRRGLVVAEVALAMMLVVASGLMLRSFRAMSQVDPGFRPENLLGLTFTLSTQRHGDNYRQVYAQILERVRALPGVVAAGAAKDAPFRGPGEGTGFRLPGTVIASGEDVPSARMLNVSDGYFHAVGARITGGREFLPTDRANAPPVAVVNEALARRWFPGRVAVGQRLLFAESTLVEIVGTVADIRQTEVASDAQETVYFHEQQNGRVRMSLLVRTSGPPLAMAGAVRSAIHDVDPLQTITDTYAMEDAVSEALARPRLVTALLGGFGAVGLLLGAFGLYGVLAYLVRQRRKDIGVRLALGASRRRVLGMVVGQGMRLTAIGVVVGVLGALASGRVLAGVLFGVTTTDPVTYLGVACVLFVTALGASLLPARWAAGVDVVRALRDE